MIKFGTSGFRAIIGEEFTKENTQRIAQALANIIKPTNKPVIIGYDRRFMSDYFAKWFAEVLAGNKIQTKIYSAPVPSPAVMFGVKKENLDYGVIITASHNPYKYNGIKICTKGGQDTQLEFTQKLEKIANKRNLKIKKIDYELGVSNQLICTYDNIKEYIKNLDNFVSKNLKYSDFKILFNAMFGVTAESAKLFANHFKLEKFDIINTENDPYFKHTLPCPNEESLEEFKKQVTRGKYKIGLACDADGDRLGIIDEQGNYYSNNIIMAIIYYYLIKYRNMSGSIVKNCSTSIIIDKLAQKFGQKCYETPVGFKWVSNKMLETNALIGGESSGGITVKDYILSKDSMLSIALILDAIATIKKPISKIAQEVEKFCGYISTFYESSIKVNNRKKFEKIIAKKSPNFSYKPIKVIRTDGVKYIFEDNNWILLRFSGTENVLRYCLEFTTEIECERNIKSILKFVNEIDNS